MPPIAFVTLILFGLAVLVALGVAVWPAVKDEWRRSRRKKRS